MSLKKIVAVYNHTGGSIGTQVIDTGYTVPSGKVLIVSSMGGHVISTSGKASWQTSIEIGFFANNNRANGTGIYNTNGTQKTAGKGFIFTSGERIYLQVDYSSSQSSGYKICGVLCGEEVVNS